MKKRLLLLFSLLLLSVPATAKAEDICGGNHKWSDWEVVEKEDCSNPGSKRRECSECYANETMIIPATGQHKWSDWEYQDEYDCLKKMKKTRECRTCYDVQTSIEPAHSSHQWGNWYYTDPQQKPTCAREGLKTRVCTRCAVGIQEQKESKVTVHELSDWEITEQPDALHKGRKTRACDCGLKFEKRSIPKLKSEVILRATTLKIKKGKTYKLKIRTFTTGDGVSKWTSSNPKVATVGKKNGKIKALKKGKTKITVTMKSGCKAVCKVTVKK